MRARRTPVLAAVTAALALVTTTAALPSAPTAAAAPAATERHSAQRVLETYAADTWKSFEAMAVPATGLPADNIGGDLDPATRSGFTSPTNIGAYLWSTAAARDTGLIGRREAKARMTQDPRLGRRPRAPRRQRHVLQLVRPGHRRQAAHLPRVRRDDQAVPLLGRQRVAGHRAAAHRPRRAVAGQEGRPDPRGHGLRLLLQRAGERARRPDPRRLLGRGPARGRRRQGRLLRRRRRVVHRPPLRRVQHRAPDRVVPRHRRRPDPGPPLLRHLPDLPQRHLRLVLDRDQGGRLLGRAPRASASSRARCPTAACRSCRPGAAACSRR